MKTLRPLFRCSGWLLTAGCLCCFAAAAGQLQLVTLNPGQSPAGGGGDSSTPIITPDGRYVLFSSTACNLVLTTNGTPIPAHFAAVLNAYLRDRTNGTTTLMSTGLAGGGANGDSIPAGISTNGRYASFASSASDILPGDTNGTTDVFVRDLAGGTTALVSANTNGIPADGASYSPTMTPDGRYVAFVSLGNDVVAGDTNGISDVFVRDMQSGLTTLVSTGAVTRGTGVSLSKSAAPEITPDGHYVAFYSTANNLVSGVPAGGDIYVRDVTAGATTWASTGARAALQLGPQSAQAVCYNHLISADGQFVAYEASTQPGTTMRSTYSGCVLRYSLATGLTDVIHTNAFVSTAPYEDISTLAMTPDGRFIAFLANTNGTLGATTCVLLWDAQTGGLTLVSGDTNNLVPANSVCDWPAIDDTGRFVSFLSSATGLTTNSLAGAYHLYLRDIRSGTTTLLDGDTNGIGSVISPSTRPVLNSACNLVAFAAGNTHLVPNNFKRAADVFVRDLGSGSVDLISAHDPALPSSSPDGPSAPAPQAISGNGRYVAFATDADNLAPNDTNGCWDVFVADLAFGTNVLVSVATNGFSGDGSSSAPALSPDARYVAFTSSADNLVNGDTNGQRDVFLRDLQAGTTTLVSVNSGGTGSANGSSFSPQVSTNDRFVLFRSTASNLVPGSFSFGTGSYNLFLRDLQMGTTVALTTMGCLAYAMTPDGHFVACQSGTTTSFYPPLYVWDSLQGKLVYSNNFIINYLVTLHPDGKRIIYTYGSSLRGLDRVANTNWLISSNVLAGAPGLRFSSDGRYFTYSATPRLGYTNQVYLYDFRTGTNQLLSHRWDSPVVGAYGASDAPDLSADGRFVAFHSAAIDLLPGPNNTVAGVFLYDSQTGSNTLVTLSRYGNSVADNWSLAPVFSGDGHTLVFESWASDLAGQDFNQAGDIFAYTLLYAAMVPGQGPGQPPQVTWKLVPGASYRVQFKNDLNDPNWRDAAGTTINVGNTAFFQETEPPGPQKFYRVVSP